ncbi:MAG: chorismate synthase [Candidatus Marinimicrobia bacterium]|nr:chorismate synthase [Candidatus Neomarinimicrobiota bacterium]MBL7022889.1 chorismate synthase [Candidatus Neomarinimicrobiota bacterium]MBL7109208.1 chorismate synthase [Candidatus Neomarinimicrobiota bacterium]
MKYLTAGESHGKGLIGILEGIPAGLEISEEIISLQLSRRQMGYGRGDRMKIENDYAEIWSGVRFGKTLGSPIAMLVRNKDYDNWQNAMSIESSTESSKKVTLPRPGHADLAGIQKYGFNDIRNVIERASARETAMRVALATICRELLNEVGIEIGSRVVQIHKVKDNSAIPNIALSELNDLTDKSPVRCLDTTAEKQMIQTIENAKENGDSVGGIFEVIATGLPYGLGSYSQWYSRLNTQIAESIMSIPAIKGVEIGLGFESAERFGSEFHDEITLAKEHDHKEYIQNFSRLTNNAGGIEGGMSNAKPIVVRAIMKPIPTLTKPLQSVDIKSKEIKSAHKERTDSCAVPAASIVGESMLCFVLADALLDKFGGDSMEQLKTHINKTGKY